MSREHHEYKSITTTRQHHEYKTSDKWFVACQRRADRGSARQHEITGRGSGVRDWRRDRAGYVNGRQVYVNGRQVACAPSRGLTWVGTRAVLPQRRGPDARMVASNGQRPQPVASRVTAGACIKSGGGACSCRLTPPDARPGASVASAERLCQRLYGRRARCVLHLLCIVYCLASNSVAPLSRLQHTPTFAIVARSHCACALSAYVYSLSATLAGASRRAFLIC